MKYKINDYELLYMIRENDDDSKDLLYKKYMPIIKRIASDYYYRYKDYGYDYEDFIQEGLIAFQKAIISYDEQKEVLFYTFAIVCIKRSLITFSRNISSPKKVFPNTEVISYDMDCVDSSADIESIEAYREIEVLVKKILWDLDFDSSCIFELKINGFNFREIGILLDIPTSTAEYKNRVAKNKFRDYFEKYIKRTV